MSLILNCSYCKFEYISNNKNSTRLPYLLQCKHSVCNVCVQNCILNKSSICDSLNNNTKSFDCEICKVSFNFLK